MLRIASVEPRVPCKRPLELAELFGEPAEDTEPVRERAAGEEALVRRRAGVVDDGRRSLVLEHHELVVREGLLDPVAILAGDGRRLLAEPDELRVAVREARPGQTSLVDERVDVGEPLGECGADPQLPCLRDSLDLSVRQVGEGPDVLGRVDDDLLALEGRVEVGDDADLPRLPDCQRLRRCAVLPSGVEGAAFELFLGRGVRPG